MIHQMKCGALCEAGIDPDTFNWSDSLFPRLEQTTFIDRVFGGYLRSQLHCTNCGYNSNSYDHFHDLLLEISHKKCTSLLTAFQHYTKAETLGYDNQWKCCECGESVMAQKQLTVFRAPLTLCICLKRFSKESGVTTIALCILNKAPPNAYNPQMILNISNIDDVDKRQDQNH